MKYKKNYYTVSTRDGENRDFYSKVEAFRYARKVGARFVDCYDKYGDLIEYFKVEREVQNESS